MQNILNLIYAKHTNKMVFIVFVMLAFSYIYFANGAVRSVTNLEHLSLQKESFDVKIGDLESENIVFKDKVSIEKAKSIGLVEAKPIFIVKKANNKVLSLLR